MDNVLAVASFIPVVGDLADVGVQVTPLWWGMLMGGTILGNLTFIGSTANIVAIGMLEREEKQGHHVHGVVLAGACHGDTVAWPGHHAALHSNAAHAVDAWPPAGGR